MKEKVKFKGENGKQTGLKVGDWLVVAKDEISWLCKIYRLDTGRPLINVSWISIDDAISFAEWLDETYREYFPIWEVEPRANIFLITQWTIKNGVKINRLIEMLREIGRGTQLDLETVSKIWKDVNNS